MTTSSQLRSQGTTRGRTMGSFTPIAETAKSREARADWIDYRASRSRVFKRRDAGETPEICEVCETELDVDDVVHSPKCKVFLGEQPKTTAADWDQNAVITAIRLWAESHDGEPPSSEDWRRAVNGCPSYAIVAQLFGSWNDGITAAGFEPRPHHRAPLEEREPEAEEVLAGTHDSVTPAVPTAEPASRSSSRGRKASWTRETAIARIREVAIDGLAPPVDEVGITWTAIKRLFGSYAALVEAAGLRKRPHGRSAEGRALAAAAAGRSLGAAAMPQTAMPVPASELLATPPQPSEAAEPLPDSLPQDEAEEPEETEAPPGREILGLTAAQLIVAGRLMEAIADSLVSIAKTDRRAVWAAVEPLVSEVLDA